MATLKRANLRIGGNKTTEILVNLDRVTYMQRSSHGYTSIHFGENHSINIEEDPDLIATLTPVVPPAST